MSGELPGPVSAVVCNYNGERYLEGCLDSLLALEGELDEVVVVDNGSDDDSLALLERYPEVRVVKLGKNYGPCRARNEGMRAAKNRWVLAVDNDAILQRDNLRLLREAIRDHPGSVAAQPRSVFAGETDRVHYDGGHFHYGGLISLRNFYRPLAEAEGEGAVPVDALIGIAILLDRDRVLEFGGYDESFFILFEDYDLALRLRIAGLTILSVENAIVLHRGGTPGISFRRGKEYPAVRAYYHSRNRWLLLAKNHAWRTLFLSLPGLLAYELAWALFTLIKGNIGALLLGKMAFFRDLPAALRERKKIQARRRLADGELLVGGPLTVTPELERGKGPRLVLSVLDGFLAGWWRLVRPLCR